MATRTTAPPATTDRSSRGITAPGLLLGIGLGGLVDGILLHQILQWHHMLTDYGGHASFPATTVPSLEDNTLWDGLFHAGTWMCTLVGILLLWRAVNGGRHWGWRSLVGLMLAGWGLFNVVEGIVNHLILTVHHVRDDLGGPLAWDIGFLVFGALLVLAGTALRGSDREGIAGLRRR